MTLVKKNKMMRSIYRRWDRMEYRNLYDCYGRPSPNKVKAYKDCIDLQTKYSGSGLKIIGYNCNTFSVGFVGKYFGRDAFFYITKDYDRVMYLDED